ncbi:uncharacterized protein LOC100571238 [Acyrthosiphon pisum]|uniref:ACYPI24610 protein n=1 Tax=Acyrthosiphon pisum TaxID=7029 RepID=C4WWQ4_ACYPI|nr:uncharacterized protein LOC100571238 [Acyrthosiphon pisum]BAH72324.1 ACYPI24610 [Acyrthosiphon pisum]|eukprot:NP_001233004.1 uncharacterized protein LOC100571238 [Acyrthosiphon pisum]
MSHAAHTRDINAIRTTHGIDPISALQCGAAVVQLHGAYLPLIYRVQHVTRVIHTTGTPPRNSANTHPIYYYGRLFSTGRAVRLAVHIRVLQVLPGQSARRRAGRVPLRQRHQARAPARGVRRVRRVRKRPTAVRLMPRNTMLGSHAAPLLLYKRQLTRLD